MIRRLSRLSVVTLLACTLVLSGCETSRERAERLYESGLALAQAGDFEAALSEFRQALELDPDNRKALLAVPETLVKLGRGDEAYDHYIALLIRFPEEIGIAVTTAEMALERGNLPDANFAGTIANSADPSSPRNRAVQVAIDYTAALAAEDTDASERAAEAARAILDEDPDAAAAVWTVTQHLMAGPDPAAALPYLDRALEQEPNSLDLQMRRLRVFSLANDHDRAITQMEAMYKRFPDQRDVQGWLYDAYIWRGDTDAAIMLMREVAARFPDDPAPRMRVVDLLQQTKGSKAAAAELKALADAAAGTSWASEYRIRAAQIDHAEGHSDEAIAALRAELSRPAADTTALSVALARILNDIGDTAAARPLVDAVLQESPYSAEALKLRAEWLLEENKPREALTALSQALAENPRDPKVLTLLAAAYEADGATALAGQNLALAVEVSNSAPEETLLLYKFLMRTNRARVADSVLRNAVAANEDPVEILTAAAEVAMGASDWTRSENIITELRTLGTEKAEAAAARAQAVLTDQRARIEALLARIDALSDPARPERASSARDLALMVEQGKIDTARVYIASLLAVTPGDPELAQIDQDLAGLIPSKRRTP
jgi:cellulose synthase operon protein C